MKDDLLTSIQAAYCRATEALGREAPDLSAEELMNVGFTFGEIRPGSVISPDEVLRAENALVSKWPEAAKMIDARLLIICGLVPPENSL